jgi:hypothetical protein
MSDVLYRPFALSSSGCPPEISSSYLKSCMTMLTYMDELDPREPGFEDVRHMYLLVLKHDIIQAAFSVCYYIKRAPDNLPGPVRPNSHWQPGVSPGPSEGAASGHDGQLWSASTLIATVERTLDSLIGIIKDSSSDLRDIVALSIVLQSVQVGPPEQKLDKIKVGIRRILDIALQVLGMRSDKLGALPVSSQFSIFSTQIWS